MRRRFGPTRRPAILLVLLVLAWAGVRCWQDSSGPRAPESLAEGTYTVERVVDGDTLLLQGGVRVRLIGADTPETVRKDFPIEPWGPEATDFTRAFVASGQVRLEFDHERLDQYGRFLAYVWVDGRMLNEELLRAGLARARLEFHYSESKQRAFERAEEEARRAGRGMWSKP